MALKRTFFFFFCFILAWNYTSAFFKFGQNQTERRKGWFFFSPGPYDSRGCERLWWELENHGFKENWWTSRLKDQTQLRWEGIREKRARVWGCWLSVSHTGDIIQEYQQQPRLNHSKTTKKPPKNSNGSVTELTNSRFKHLKLQPISHSGSSLMLCVLPRGQWLQQLWASGARRCPTTFHVQSPMVSVRSFPLESVLCSLHVWVGFLQTTMPGQLMPLAVSFNSLIHGGCGVCVEYNPRLVCNWLVGTLTGRKVAFFFFFLPNGNAKFYVMLHFVLCNSSVGTWDQKTILRSIVTLMYCLLLHVFFPTSHLLKSL